MRNSRESPIYILWTSDSETDKMRSGFTVKGAAVMKKNDLLTLRCENLGAELEGVCRPEGMAVFVPGLLPGEEAPVRIVKTEKRFAFGRMEAPPVSPSADRRDPDCPVFPRCGGCSCRHMSYEATLEAKRRKVADCFSRIAGIPMEIPPLLGMDHPYQYRNKTALPVGGTAKEPVLGFFAPRSHRLIPADACPNAMAPTSGIAAAVRTWVRRFGIDPYMEETHSGLLRHLVIRVNRNGESMVTLAINGNNLPHAEDLWKLLTPLRVVSLYININREKTNVIFGESFRLIYGSNTLTDILCGLRFELSPASFFQVNPEQTEKLYATALAFADVKETDTLCDVYCGAGTISLMMARKAKKVTGIEIVPAAIENAKENAARNGIANADFYAGRAEDLLPRMVRDGLRPDVIVVDPPRKGLELSVIDAIAQAKPERLVYVSCDVATQARDAALLSERGYRPVKAQSVDMFCWTSGVENVLLLSKR